jgi:hypothetical protein
MKTTIERILAAVLADKIECRVKLHFEATGEEREKTA